MQGFFDFVKSLGAARMAAMAAVTLALIGFFSFITLQVTAPHMVPLFTDLTVEDSSSIIKDLERQGIAYELKNDGAIVMVAKDKVARLRMKLAESGLPKGGGVGYEIFDKTDALGSTTFIQNINKLRALEGELARTIRSLDRVQTARVHLVLPDRPLFSRDKIEPTASIVLKVRGQLEPSQVRAIRHLVASAVTGMRPERVSVIDETGRLLADGAAPEDASGVSSIDERKTAYEKRLREQVEAIVTSVVGPGHARVELNADFDLNRITQTSDKFDPEGRVVRSSQTREEQSASGDGGGGGAVSVGNELPGSKGSDGGARDQNHKTEEIVNYEISRTTKTEVTEAGRVNRISAAVLLDGIYAKNDKGEVTYQPRPKEEIDRIAALVRSAIGFDSKRGDQVEVVNLRFADTPAVPITEPVGWMSYFNFAFTKDDIMRGAELGVMALLGLIVVFTVVRPLVRRVVTPEGMEGRAALAGAAGVAGAVGAA
ncbi:MAG TPA: flagellar basal-body MS-ring/collar protein FliF, partial [Pseudolabrys sp.]|nr:flagellar basal-body MS-ring/collar protein FliF [Pseudolabrys sp.]